MLEAVKDRNLVQIKITPCYNNVSNELVEEALNKEFAFCSAVGAGIVVVAPAGKVVGKIISACLKKVFQYDICGDISSSDLNSGQILNDFACDKQTRNRRNERSASGDITALSAFMLCSGRTDTVTPAAY